MAGEVVISVLDSICAFEQFVTIGHQLLHY